MVPLKYKILFIAPLLLISCKPKQVITEKISSRTDSSAVVLLEDEISQKETQIASLQSDLNRFRDENLILCNEVSTHEINYDTTQPINPDTQKPPISSEKTTTSNTHLQKTINQYEILLRDISIENKNLTTENHNLQLTVESLVEENKELKTEKTSRFRFNHKLFFLVIFLVLYIIMCIFKWKTKIDY